jgi:hypothetical protein
VLRVRLYSGVPSSRLCSRSKNSPDNCLASFGVTFPASSMIGSRGMAGASCFAPVGVVIVSVPCAVTVM